MQSDLSEDKDGSISWIAKTTVVSDGCKARSVYLYKGDKGTSSVYVFDVKSNMLTPYIWPWERVNTMLRLLPLCAARERACESMGLCDEYVRQVSRDGDSVIDWHAR